MHQPTAIICGSDLRQYSGLYLNNTVEISSQYGELSSEVFQSTRTKAPLYFLARHGTDTSIAPHLINYRANIDVLHQLGVKQIVAINTVGGLRASMGPGVWVCPDQIIDYTYGREQTFFDGINQPMQHVDFSFPFANSLRDSFIEAAVERKIKLVSQATYAVTQGPRLETGAEIKRLQNDGCDIVGMTMMPEAILAREMGMGYASICFVANWGAGMEQHPLDIDAIYAMVKEGFTDIVSFLADYFQL